MSALRYRHNLTTKNRECLRRRRYSLFALYIVGFIVIAITVISLLLSPCLLHFYLFFVHISAVDTSTSSSVRDAPARRAAIAQTLNAARRRALVASLRPGRCCLLLPGGSGPYGSRPG